MGILVFVWGLRAAEPDLNERLAERVHFRLGERPVTLKEVERMAWTHIAERDPQFIKASPPPVFHVDPDKKYFVSVSYSTDLGKPYWRVTIGRKGEISSYTTGIGRDEVGVIKRRR